MGIASLALVCALIPANMAEAKAQTPPAAPRFVIVRDTFPKQGTITLFSAKAYMERIPVKFFVNINGRVEERTQYVNRGVIKYDTLDARDSCVMTPDGAQLRIDEVWKRLKPGTVLVVSGDGNRPAPAYLRALDPETLVFIPAPTKKGKP